MRKKPLQESRPCINCVRDKSRLLMGKKILNVAAISFTVALGSLGLFFQPFLIVRVLSLFLNKKSLVSRNLFFILHFLHHYLSIKQFTQHPTRGMFSRAHFVKGARTIWHSTNHPTKGMFSRAHFVRLDTSTKK